MKINRIDHVGINVNDLAAAKAFFLDLGFELQGQGSLEGAWLDRIVGLNDVKTSLAFFRVPGGQGPDGQGQGQTSLANLANLANIELVKYHAPSDENGIQQPLATTLGIGHIAF